VPLYWLFTGLMVLALFLFSGEVAHTSFSLEHLLASLFFVPWPNQDGETLPILILGWTLNYEMLFSVLFAVASPCSPASSRSARRPIRFLPTSTGC
jgi:exopolysaccharide production protein ExoZ